MKKLFLLISCVVALSSCGKKAADNASNTDNAANTEVAASAGNETVTAEPIAISAYDEKDAVNVAANGLRKMDDGKWELMYKAEDGLKRVVLADDVTVVANGVAVSADSIDSVVKKKDISYWLNEAGLIAHIVVK